MRAIDTNVVARFLLNDDPVQSPIAQRVMAGGVFVPATVLLETAWLLASRYNQPRDVIAEALAALTDLPTVHVVERALLRWAISRYRDGADFADMIHISGSVDNDSFASFEKRLARLAGPDAPIIIDTLG